MRGRVGQAGGGPGTWVAEDGGRQPWSVGGGEQEDERNG
jgi:hypothetical protein